MTWFSSVARPPLLHIHTSIIIIIIIIVYKEGRKTSAHTRERSQSYAPLHARARRFEGPKNDGGVPPPPLSKELGLNGSSIVSIRVVVANTRVGEWYDAGWKGGGGHDAWVSVATVDCRRRCFRINIALNLLVFFGVFILSLFFFFFVIPLTLKISMLITLLLCT